MMKKPLIIITGPTASGKTALSVELAKKIGGEIISADSMQVYRHMDIGSAKVTKEEMDGVRHHLIDVLNPWDEFNVVVFQKLAKEAMEEIYAAGHIPIIAGGTGFYIQALLYDIDFKENDEKNPVREELEQLAEKLGYEFYDQEIIKMTAGTTGLSQDYISRKEENMTNSLLYDLVNQVYMYAQTNEEAPKDKIYEAESRVIKELAEKGNCVIVGRCSDYILRKNTNCLKVFFSAPMENRVKRVMKRQQLSEKEAIQKIQKEDKRRADNYRYYTGRMWGMAANFDLTLNTEIGMEYIEKCICEAMKK